MKEIDIIILSYAKSEHHYNLTLNCIDSLAKAKYSNYFNITIVETNSDVNYHVDTLHIDKPFNYNEFANIAARRMNSHFIGIFNNDVVFDHYWYSNLLKYYNDAELFSCSPISLTSNTQHKYINSIFDIEGYEIGKHISGWAIVLTRKLFEFLGGLDTTCTFWCSDDAYAEQLKENKIPHYLLPKCVVNHVDGGSNTLRTFDEKTKDILTFEQAKKFNKKFNANKFNLNKSS